MHDLTSLLAAAADSTVAVAAGRDLASFIADDGNRRQSLRGFEDIYADIVHYIMRSTDRMWDGAHGTRLIEDHYTEDVPLHTTEGTVTGRTRIMEMTARAKEAFPGLYLHGEDVVWCGDDEAGFETSHRITHQGTNTGPSSYGAATGQPIRRAAVAHCRVLENRITEEWLTRDELSVVRALGFDEITLAHRLGTADRAAGRSHTPDAFTSNPGEAQSAAEALALDLFRTVWTDRDHGQVGRLFHSNAPIETSTARRLEGPEGHVGWAREWQDEFSDVSLEVHHIMSNRRAGGDIVATRWWLEGTHDGSSRYGPATGRRVKILGFSHHLVADGAIAAEWTVYDEFALLKQLYGE